MFKKFAFILASMLMLSGCSANNSNFSSSPELLSNTKAKSYTSFQNKLNDAFDSALYKNEPVLVTTVTNSNYNAQDSKESILYFAANNHKFKASFALSDSNDFSNKIKSYYQSCPVVKDMVTVSGFTGGSVNSYEGNKYYIAGAEMWQVIIDSKGGATVQYFSLNDNGLLLKQEVALVSESDKLDVKNWKLGDVKDYIDSTREKTTVSYIYDDFNNINVAMSKNAWIKLLSSNLKILGKPLFLNANGGTVKNVSSSSDGLSCVAK
jgi:hypothetical protein